MKLGILGDIHGNLAALQAVLEAFDTEGVEKIFCAGDVVGYGPQPRECIELVRERKIECAMGNHDEYVTQLGRDDWRITEDAKIAIVWTQNILSSKELQWLACLPRLVRYKGVEILHGSHVPSPRWRYVLNERTAAENFLFQNNLLTFNGHTHLPLLVKHRSGSAPVLTHLRSFYVRPGQRFLVGVGSVGQPRDQDPRACAVVYDTESDHIRLLRVPYDIDATRKRIREAGLPESLAVRLAIGK